MVKKFFALMLSVFLLCICACSSADAAAQQVESHFFKVNDQYIEVRDYQELERSFLDYIESSGVCEYAVYDSSELTAEILENRNGVIIVERCIGIVSDKDTGDGILLNTDDSYYNYIHYFPFGYPLNNGTVMLSYMVYNPTNNFVDDILERYDFVLSREWEDTADV